MFNIILFSHNILYTFIYLSYTHILLHKFDFFFLIIISRTNSINNLLFYYFIIIIKYELSFTCIY